MTPGRTALGKWSRLIVIGCLVVLGVGVALRGQSSAPKAAQADNAPAKERGDEESREEKAHVERWKRRAAEIAITVQQDTALTTTLKLVPDPILRWTNPVRPDCYGLAFLWTRDGQPAAISDFYRMKIGVKPVESHFFVSLSETGLSAKRGGRTEWAPKVAGITPKPIPGAAHPSPSSAERLRQMRTLAREFSAFVDHEKGRTELRLLSQPIFRNEPTPQAESGDGALFSYVLGTDPEVLLLIADRPGPDGRAWHYAFARCSTHSLRATHRGDTVWEVEKEHPGQGDSPTKPYFTVRDDPSAG